MQSKDTIPTPEVEIAAAGLLSKIKGWRKDGLTDKEVLDEVILHLRDLVGVHIYGT